MGCVVGGAVRALRWGWANEGERERGGGGASLAAEGRGEGADIDEERKAVCVCDEPALHLPPFHPSPSRSLVLYLRVGSLVWKVLVARVAARRKEDRKGRSPLAWNLTLHRWVLSAACSRDTASTISGVVNSRILNAALTLTGATGIGYDRLVATRRCVGGFYDSLATRRCKKITRWYAIEAVVSRFTDRGFPFDVYPIIRGSKRRDRRY